MSKLHHYESCPECGSKDNLAVYVDDNGEIANKYCFTPGCSYRYKADAPTWPIGQHAAMPERGLTIQTCIKYDVRQAGYTHAFPYYDQGKVAAVEYRDYLFNKGTAGHFRTKGSTMKLFFGMNTVHTTKIIAIAFGVYDAMSVFQETGVPCLSTSDSRLKNCLAHHYQWLASFQKIILVPDNDDSCMAAIEQVEGMLPRSQTYMARLSLKDSNEYLTRGLGHMLKQAFYSALPLAGNLFVTNTSSLVEPEESLGVGTLTGTYIDRYLGGLRKGEVTTILGSPSAGKTTYVRHLIAALLKGKVNCAVLSSEEGPKKFVGKMCNHYLGRMRTNQDVPALTEIISERLQVYASRDYKMDDILSFVTVAVKAYGTQVIVIDNISAIADADQLTANVAKFIKLFNDLAAELDCHIVVVSHTARQAKDRDGQPLSDVQLMQTGFGSSAIEKFSWNVVLVERDPQSPVGKIHVLKNREIGPSGCGKFLVAFDPRTWTIIESSVTTNKETVTA